jgi:hypothetical protein
MPFFSIVGKPPKPSIKPHGMKWGPDNKAEAQLEGVSQPRGCVTQQCAPRIATGVTRHSAPKTREFRAQFSFPVAVGLNWHHKLYKRGASSLLLGKALNPFT